MAARFGLTRKSHVVEIAANDGYLLQYVKALGIGCTGVEPTAAAAAAARAKGISIVEDFFGVRLARELAAEGRQADLTVANNVLAHVPDINDFVSGFTSLLKPSGVATFEFPHLLNLIGAKPVRYDLSRALLVFVSHRGRGRYLRRMAWSIFDVEEHPTHGGSLRVFAQRAETGRQPRSAAVDDLLQREKQRVRAAPDTIPASRTVRKKQRTISCGFCSIRGAGANP